MPSGSILTGGAVVPRGTVISMCPAEVACWSTFVHLDVEWTRSQMGVGVKGLGLVAVVLLAPFPVVAVVVTAVVVIVVVAIGVVVVVVGLECGLLVHVMCLLLLEHNLLLELRVGVGEVGNGGLGGLMASCELGERLFHLQIADGVFLGTHAISELSRTECGTLLQCHFGTPKGLEVEP